jgi:hypothetical protein
MSYIGSFSLVQEYPLTNINNILLDKEIKL